MPRPLRILVTRAAHQSSALADRLRELDADPIVIPTLQIVPPASFDALDAALDELATFDWLVLTSANAAEALIARLGSRELPDGLHIAAIGAASAAALQPLGRTADLIPPQAVAESLAESLLPHALGHRFLLIRAEQARDYIPDALRQAGAIVVIAPAYRTTIPAGAIDALRSLFSDPGQHPDAITFTSSSSVQHLFDLLADAGLTLPSDIRRVSIGPITSQTLRDFGYPPHAEAPQATVSSLAEAVTSGEE
jgi:uroporphyrinogen-III synthase